MAFQPLGHRLFEAARIGDVSLTLKLFKNKVKTNLTDEKGNSPLDAAVSSGNVFIAKLLIEYGADIEHQNRQLNRPVHIAAMNGNTEMLALLLSKGANSNVSNHEGFTPIQLTHCDSEVYNMLSNARNGTLPDEFEQVNDVPVIPVYSIPVPKIKSDKGKKNKKKGGNKKKGKKKKKR